MGKARDFIWTPIQTDNRPLLYHAGVIWIVSQCGPRHWSADSKKALLGENSRGGLGSQPELLPSASSCWISATSCFRHVAVFSREQARLWKGEWWLRYGAEGPTPNVACGNTHVQSLSRVQAMEEPCRVPHIPHVCNQDKGTPRCPSRYSCPRGTVLKPVVSWNLSRGSSLNQW